MRLGAHNKLLCLFISCLLLTGCSGHNKRVKELHDYMQDVKGRPAKKVDPIPTFSKYKPFAYTAKDKRSPFKPAVTTTVAQGSNILPDINRPKEKLEGFPLDSLKMVGTLSKNGQVWALVSAPDKVVYRLQVGSHLGKNYGEIEQIAKDKIILVETVPNGLGGWKKRQVIMNIDDE